MKTLVKLTLAFVLGIIITATVIVPRFNGTPSDTPEIQAEIKESAATEALAIAEMKAKPAEIQAEQEPETTAVEEIPEPTETFRKTEPEPTPTIEPVTESEKATSPPQTTPAPQKKQTEPEYFYEDGKKYAYINGIKSLIADDPDSVQIDYYDWENDPAGQIRGPFN
jgi:outer membrane biosynthesis protein TonB